MSPMSLALHIQQHQHVEAVLGVTTWDRMFFFSRRRRHTMWNCDWSSDVCSSDLDKDSVTSLHRAAMGGHPAAVRVLLQYGANVNAMDGMFSAAALACEIKGRKTS